MNQLESNTEKFEVVLLTLKKLIQSHLGSNPQAFLRIRSILQDIMTLFDEHSYNQTTNTAGHSNVLEFTPDSFQIALRDLRHGQSIGIGTDTSRADEFDYFLVPTQEYFNRPEEISKVHATIYCEDRECWLTDLDSTNGTTLNGRPAKAKAELRLVSGDMLSFGARERSYMYIKSFDVVDEKEQPKSVWQTLLSKNILKEIL